MGGYLRMGSSGPSMSATVMPRRGRVTLPVSMIWDVKLLTVLMGMQKPRPSKPRVALRNFSVGMPTSSPLALSSAPPELPELMAASIWITEMPREKLLALMSSRSSPEMMPAVTVPKSTSSMLPGLPMQMASSPMRSASESPSGIGSAPAGAGSEKCRMAMSVPSS